MVPASTQKKKKENRSVQRVELESALKVVMGSIGSNVKYSMSTSNISTNGFFLDFDKPGRFPFTLSSIMEVWMDLDENNKIFFNGKLARVVLPSNESDSRPGIAIKIIQIDKENEQTLRSFVEMIAEKAESSKG